MKLLVAADAHVYRTMDGKYWTPKIYGYNFWTRYLDVFEDVRIVARLKEVDSFSEKWLRVDGPHVEVYGIPFYQGPKQLLMKYVPIQSALKNAYSGCQAALIRMPGQTSYMTYQHLPKEMPIAGEIVYDPTDDVNDKSSGILMNLINRRIASQLREFCKNVNGVSYVTSETIQKHFPSRAKICGSCEEYFESSYSTITLNEDAFTGSRKYKKSNSITVALSDVAMNSERKGERTLINAIRIARENGYTINAVIIGDGSKRDEFEKLANQYNLTSQIRFTGLLPSADEVRQVLLSSDVFVFPTKAEGLPRGILEAMAIGMPVLSSPVGGIPEILDEECLLDPKNAEEYAERLCRFVDDPELMNRLSQSNFEKSLAFKNTILQEKRNKFYKKLRKIAEKSIKV